MSETMKPHHFSHVLDFDETDETYGNNENAPKFDLSHYLTPELSNEVDSLMNMPRMPPFDHRLVEGII